MIFGLFEPSINQFGCCQTAWWVIYLAQQGPPIGSWQTGDKNDWFFTTSRLKRAHWDLPTHAFKLKPESYIFQRKPTRRCQATHPAFSSTETWVWLIPKTTEEATSYCKGLFIGVLPIFSWENGSSLRKGTALSNMHPPSFSKNEWTLVWNS